jgi:hypothetical protein
MSGYLAFFAPEHNGWRGTSAPACSGHADYGQESGRTTRRKPSTTDFDSIHGQNAMEIPGPHVI